MLRRLLDLLPVAAAAWLLWKLVGTWAARVPYPFDLEWMEGGMLAHAWRLQHGLPLYTEPGPDWIPFIYPPGYASLVAAVGADYAPARLLSLGGTLAAAAAIPWATAKAGGSTFIGMLCAVAFLGCYPFTGSFYDLVRLDGVCIGLLAWSLALGLDRRRFALEGAALLLCAAFLFKQNVALFGVPLLIGIASRDGWVAGARFAAWSALPALGVTGVLEVASGGLYLDYLVGVPASHPLVGWRIVPGTPRELGWALGWLVLGVAIWAVRQAPSQTRRWALGVAGALVLIDWLAPEVPGIPKVGDVASALGAGAPIAACIAVTALPRSWRSRYGVGVAVVGFVTSALMRGHHGGFLNVHIQLFWVTALVGAVALSRLPRQGAIGAVAPLLLAVQLLWQNAWLDDELRGAVERALPAAARARVGALLWPSGWRIEELVPTEQDRAVGEEVVALVRAQAKAPVLAPHGPWIAAQAGFEPGLHLISLWDVTHDRSPFPRAKRAIEEAAETRHWGTVLDGPRSVGYGVTRYYEKEAALGASGAFQPKTGWRARPKTLLLPRESP